MTRASFARAALRLLAVVAVVGCGEGGDEPERFEHRFTLRPVRIAAADTLPEACVEALEGVTRYLASFGASAYLVVESGLVEGELARAGTIAVLPGRPTMRPGQIAHGETRWALTIGGNIVGSEVVLATCDARAVTHEVLHGLGLVHSEEPGNIMRSELPLAGWGLTEAQVAWIAD